MAVEKVVRRAYIEVVTSNDHMPAPRYAMVEVDPAFCKKLADLLELTEFHGLTQCRIARAPDQWGPGDIGADLGLYGGELVVADGEFYFVAQPKGGDHCVETRMLSVEKFLTAVADVSADVAGTQLYFFAEDSPSLAEDVMDELADEAKKHMH